MTNFDEIHLGNALTEYALANGANLDDDSCWSINHSTRDENAINGTGYPDGSVINWTHPTIAKPDDATLISFYDTWKAALDAGIAANEAMQAVEDNAETQAQNIPNWAVWNETQALNWHDTNIAAKLPVSSLAEANDVLADLETENRALVRMVLALRNKVFPNLQGS